MLLQKTELQDEIQKINSIFIMLVQPMVTLLNRNSNDNYYYILYNYYYQIHNVCLQYIKEGYRDTETETSLWREKILNCHIENLSKML
jgi:hypothetical protein